MYIYRAGATFLCSKKKKGRQRKARKTFKAYIYIYIYIYIYMRNVYSVTREPSQSSGRRVSSFKDLSALLKN